MKVSLQIPRFEWPGSPANLGQKLREIAQAAEAAGFDSIWVMDHFFQIEGLGKAEELMLEGYTALSFMAGVTTRVRLGTLVTGANYRHAGYLLKVVSALDVLSGGRAWLGIGAGWYEREARGLGMPFPPLKERFERLEETLRIVKQVWSGDFSPFQGKHHQLAEPINNPQPLTRPHPPILIGGGGEKKTLRLVAQYANACNLFPMPTDALRHKLDVLKGHCAAVGRNYDEIERTMLVPAMMAGKPSDLIQSCREWAGVGIQHIMLSDVPSIADIKPLELIGRDVIPVVAEL